ncbi:MAG: tetratricopeptide repeat protein, partial [Desulfomonilaceae bacterium]
TCASYIDWKSHYSGAQTLAAEGRTQEALKEARLSVVDSRDRHGRETSNTVKSLEFLAKITREAGNYPKAIRLQREAYEVDSRIKGKTNPNTIRLLSQVAELTILTGDFNAGKAYYEEVLRLCEAGNRSACITAAEPMMGLARLLASEGKFMAAEKLYLSAIDKFCCFSKYQPGLKFKMAAALESLGAIYRSQGDYAHAIKCFDQLKFVYQSQKTAPDAQDGLCLSLLNLGDIYARWGKNERAIKSYKEAAVILENHPDADSSIMLGLALKGLGDTFKNKGNMALAADYYKKALVHLETVAFIGKPLYSETVKSLSNVYKEMGMNSDEQAILARDLAMN